MSKIALDEFQDQVSQLLIRHRSVLDVISKTQETAARVNRALTKAITECGCIEVIAKKQPYDTNKTLQENSANLDSHLSGRLCDHCQDVITAELGKNLFYLTALCNITDIKLSSVLKSEAQRLNTLGVFNLS
ncbi:DUF1573 domain-containing protein [Brevibacillus humidisoli]|uniref:DUF1573 domain-containing protein n=1 Tax=Brevibacillus humidisoli TaxID=2895522 RepID=UPI001E2B2677|nr:DUF1573 domain-containing protein [Brevibacillus humidisoli]UFJ40627.1 DUF1573 domain-containing protein [Brevibacillus humidisoli]